MQSTLNQYQVSGHLNFLRMSWIFGRNVRIVTSKSINFIFNITWNWCQSWYWWYLCEWFDWCMDWRQQMPTAFFEFFNSLIWTALGRIVLKRASLFLTGGNPNSRSTEREVEAGEKVHRNWFNECQLHEIFGEISVLIAEQFLSYRIT